jgi:hypothetical protein
MTSSRSAISVWLALALASCSEVHQGEHGGVSRGDAGSDASTVGGRGSDAGPAFICPPQRATSAGSDCPRSEGFAWNGAACKEILCGCAGADCAAIYASRGACEAAHAAMCHPPTSCGQPWYLCSEICPKHLVLQGGGRSFGACEGACQFDLEFGPSIVLDVGGCTDLMGQLRAWHSDGSQRVTNFSLTAGAWEEATQLSLAIEDAALEPSTGCMGSECPLNAAWITRFSQRSANAEQFFYDPDKPPPLLRTAGQFVQDLIDQVLACTGPALESCSVFDPAADPETVVCGDFAIAPTTCDCPAAFERLASLNGAPCSASCGTCLVPDSTCGAQCRQRCDAPGPTWSIYCTE